MGVAINIEIVSATGVGGVFPFVVVCFDGDVQNELYKTDATTPTGKSATWNHTFALDLTSNVKALLAAGRPEPTYLTFFLYDTGTPGIPPLGSAGVLLATVRDHGRAQGDFPIVNGNGTLRLMVSQEKTKRNATQEGHNFLGLTDHQTKVGAAAVGATALAAGIAGLAVHHKKKKGKEEEEDPEGGTVPPEDPGKKKKGGLFHKAKRSLGGGDGSSSSDEGQSGEGERGESVQVQSSSHAWWDNSSSSSDGNHGEGTREIAVENGDHDDHDLHEDVRQEPKNDYTQPDVYVEEADGNVEPHDEEDAGEYEGHDYAHQGVHDYEEQGGDDYEDDQGGDDYDDGAEYEDPGDEE